MRKTPIHKAPPAVPGGTAPGTFGLPFRNRGGPLPLLRRRAPPPLLILPDDPAPSGNCLRLMACRQRRQARLF
jgi:hypothetical protein